jgi:cytochrome P450
MRARAPVERSNDLADWVVTGYDEAQRCLQDDEHFSNDPAKERGQLGAGIAHRRREVPLGLVPMLGQVDPPEHTRLRAVVNRAFVPRTVEDMRPRIETIVRAVLDRVPRDEPFEAMRGFAEPLPVMVALEMIGIPPPDHPAVRSWSTAIMVAIAAPKLEPGMLGPAEQAKAAFEAYLRRGRERLRGYRAESVVNTLLESEEAGAMSLDEVAMMVIHVSLSGNGPTAFMLGNAVLALATHTEQQARLREDASLWPNAIEEVMRYDSPTHHVIRIVRKELLLGKKRLRKGEAVHVIIGAANRDPQRFPNPDAFDIDREDARHLSFGHGIDFCLGAPVARLLGPIALQGLIEHFDGLRLAPGAVERGDTMMLRGPRRLVIEGMRG